MGKGDRCWKCSFGLGALVFFWDDVKGREKMHALEGKRERKAPFPCRSFSLSAGCFFPLFFPGAPIPMCFAGVRSRSPVWDGEGGREEEESFRRLLRNREIDQGEDDTQVEIRPLEVPHKKRTFTSFQKLIHLYGLRWGEKLG